MSSQRSAADIRADLGHPVIDADGHVFEHYPALHQYCLDEGLEGGLYPQMANCSFNGEPNWSGLPADERLARRSFRGPWWALPLGNTRDFATAVSPAMFHDRIEELGMDFAVCYPSIGLNFPAYRDDDIRNKLCRALNRYLADSYQGLQDRLTPVAAIPTHTPEEAIEQLDFAVTELGFKAVMIGGFVPRQVPAGGEMATWIDSLGLDSAYDYDPLWQRLVELQTPASLHSGSMGWDGRRSISNFTYNHMGNFGTASEATAKSIFFGGVTHRFPDLRLGFLEGGVTWGAQMVCDLLSHWEKRGPEGLKAYDPALFEPDYFESLLAEANDPVDLPSGFGKVMQKGISTDHVVHDFEAAGITCPEDILEQIDRSYWFGCEADDPLVRLAFDGALPDGATLNAIFSSDVGHWDVPDMSEVLPEVWEQVEHGWLNEDQFRAFTFDNAHRFFSEARPDFFKNTVLESATV